MPMPRSANLAVLVERRLVEGLRHGLSSFFFACPRVGLEVADLTDGDMARDDHYVVADCLACGGRHLVKPRTGRVAEADTAANDNRPRRR